MKVQVKRTGKLLRAQVKRDKKNIVNPGQRTGSIFYMYVNRPRSRDKAYDH